MKQATRQQRRPWWRCSAGAGWGRWKAMTMVSCIAVILSPGAKVTRRCSMPMGRKLGVLGVGKCQVQGGLARDEEKVCLPGLSRDMA